MIVRLARARRSGFCKYLESLIQKLARLFTKNAWANIKVRQIIIHAFRLFLRLSSQERSRPIELTIQPTNNASASECRDDRMHSLSVHEHLVCHRIKHVFFLPKRYVNAVNVITLTINSFKIFKYGCHEKTH